MGISKVASHPLRGMFEQLHIARGHIQKFFSRSGWCDRCDLVFEVRIEPLIGIKLGL